MGIHPWIGCQKLWAIINNNFIHSTLHRAKEMMIQVRYFNRLMNYQVVRLPRSRVSVTNGCRYSPELLRAQLWIIAKYCNRLIKVLKNIGMAANTTCISVRVKF